MPHPRLVGLSANVQRPSKTRALVEAVLHAALARASRDGHAIDGRVLDLVDAGPGLGAAFTREQLTLPARAVIEAIEGADALVIGSPVHNGSYTGLFKHLFDLVDPGALAGKPVAVVATGGGLRHALVVEHGFRPLLGFFEPHQVPTAVYASEADFTDGAPTEAGVRARIAQAGGQLAALLAGARSATLAAAE